MERQSGAGDLEPEFMAISVDEEREHCIIAFQEDTIWLALHRQDVERLIGMLQEKLKDMK